MSVVVADVQSAAMSASAAASQARVAIVIVNWNGWRECIECLDSLYAQLHENFHVFIVDNDSHDDSIEHIVAWCNEPKADATWRRHAGVDRLTDRLEVGRVRHRVCANAANLAPASDGVKLTLIRSGANLGFAGGCNVGVKAAGLENYDYFWFLNADTVVDRRALLELIARAESPPNIGMVGSTIRFYDRPEVLQAMAGGHLNRSNGTTPHIGEGAAFSDLPEDGRAVERDLDYIMGASMLVTAGYIAEIGLMEEDYFLYYEDADWALRGKGKFSLGYAPRSYIFHKWGANSHQAAHVSSNTFYYRNRLRFVARFLPERLAAAKRAMFEQLLRHLVKRRWMAARIVWSTLMAAGTITANVRPRRSTALEMDARR